MSEPDSLSQHAKSLRRNLGHTPGAESTSAPLLEDATGRSDWSFWQETDTSTGPGQ